YIIKLKDSYEKYLIHLDFENIQKELIRNSDLCEFVGVDFDSWVAYAGDGAEITTKYLNKTTISDSERSACKAKINNYKKGIYKDMALAWEKRLNEIPKTQQRHVEQQTIKVILYNADFAEVKRYEIKNTRVIEVQQFKVGGYVDVFCSNTPTCIRGEEGVEAKKQQGSKPPYRIKPINAGQWVYQCDDAQITIKTKKYGNM
ncbi:MAG: hypothetical protein J5965_00165, partial [Aeriscardovia sp.]|nr:hypothetical protein [Aeriscardovia sp.]